MTYIVIAQDHTGRYVQTPGRHYHSHAEATAYAETLDPVRDPRVVEVDLCVGRGPVLRRSEGGGKEGVHLKLPAELMPDPSDNGPAPDMSLGGLMSMFGARVEGPDAGSLAEQLRVRQPLRCVDGTTLSVQASARHYCTPRNDKGPYTHVEVGFISRSAPGHWHTWSIPSHSSGHVFGQVPVAEVIGFINDHGGLMEGELPPLSMGGQGW